MLPLQETLELTHGLNGTALAASQPRLLLVEDADDVQRVIQLGLELVAGFQVVTTRSYEDWLAQSPPESPDVILLDTPSEGGDRLTQFWRRRLPQNIPIICMVARDRLQDQLQAKTQGAAAVIAKPFDLLVLVRLVSKILEQSSG